MQEALLHYIWKNSIFESKEFKADSGEVIRIIDPGLYNNDGGPDFTNARIEIAGTLWAGNIEIHLQSSDWYSHQHNTNPVYDNVILHVVSENNRSCYNSAGRQIPCIILPVDELIENRYNQLLQNKNTIPCSKSVAGIDPVRKSFWLNALSIARLENKSRYINELLALTRNSWEDTFFINLARSFGLKTNSLPFELLAKSVFLKHIISHPDNTFRTEAILFGQAGFLEEEPADDYQAMLKKEYDFNRKKYGITPVNKQLWKFLRLRPLNFPTVRIAQLCNLLSKNIQLVSQTLSCSTKEELYRLYSCEVSEYWKSHFNFGKQSAECEKKIGIETINRIIINSIVPFMFVYGKTKNNTQLQETAIRILETLPPEKNQISKLWIKLGSPLKNASDSQALIELTRQYCSKKRCLDCQIGHALLNITTI